jgi:septal ring factor EnvC (AmiA/AmiB activator)
MKKDNIDQLFENLNQDFDIEMPNLGHEQRFLDRLNSNNNLVETKPKKSYWKPLLAVAASVVLCFSLFTVLQQKPEVKDLASVSPELSKTQDFFTSAIAQELSKLNEERTPETEALISDALKQIALLEKDYQTLKTDLTESGNDKRVIYAMISNFQSRIDVLQNVMINIENIKQLKQTTL